MAQLSAKQLAMAWLNDKFHPEKVKSAVNDREEFEMLNGGREIKDSVFEEAQKIVCEEIAKHKERTQSYCDKYVTPRIGKAHTDENIEEGN